MQPSLRIALIVLCALLASERFVCAEPVAAPGGPPPEPLRVILRGDQLFVQVLSITAEENVPHYWVETTPKDLFRVFTIGGKRLSDEEAAAALAKETEVLVSHASKLLDRRYQMLFKRETLVVYVKPQHGPPPPPLEPPPPPPEFSKTEPPKVDTEPDIGFLRKVGEELVLTQFDWDQVSEYKLVAHEVEGPDGKPKTVHETVVHIHWVPEACERKFKFGQFATLDPAGRQTKGLFDFLTNQPVAVFVLDATQEFEPAHFRLCRPEAIVTRGNFPLPDFNAKYTAPAAPSECFASVKDGALIVRRTVSMHGPVGREVKTKFVAEKLPANKVKAADAAGKAIDAAALARQLAKESPVMVASSEEPVDAMYLQRVRPDTIVLTLPLEQGPPPGSIPAPAPVPLRDPPPRPMPGKAPQPKPVPQAGLPTRGSDAFIVAAQAPAPGVLPAAVEPPRPASGPPPRLVKIQALGDKLVLRTPITIAGFAPMTELPKEGEPERGKMQVFTHWDSRVIRAENFRLYDLRGQPLDAAATAKRLAQPTIALLSDHGKRVDLAWLSIYQPETVLAYVKPEAMQGGYGHGMRSLTGADEGH